MENPHSIFKKGIRLTTLPPRTGSDIERRLLDGQNVLAVMPTGAGKSICYQVPALLSGITIVVSLAGQPDEGSGGGTGAGRCGGGVSEQQPER